MATASRSRDWARTALRGIGDSLYTLFSGPDGDDVDWDAYRTWCANCVAGLGLKCSGAQAASASSGPSPSTNANACWRWPSRRAAPPTRIWCAGVHCGHSAKDCLELTRHAQQAGADIV